MGYRRWIIILYFVKDNPNAEDLDYAYLLSEDKSCFFNLLEE